MHQENDDYLDGPTLHQENDDYLDGPTLYQENDDNLYGPTLHQDNDDYLDGPTLHQENYDYLDCHTLHQENGNKPKAHPENMGVKQKLKHTLSYFVSLFPDSTLPSGKCQVYVLNVIRPVSYMCNTRMKGQRIRRLGYVVRYNKLYGSPSETEMILEDTKVRIRVVSMKGASGTEQNKTDAGKHVVKYVDCHY